MGGLGLKQTNKKIIMPVLCKVLDPNSVDLLKSLKRLVILLKTNKRTQKFSLLNLEKRKGRPLGETKCAGAKT